MSPRTLTGTGVPGPACAVVTAWVAAARAVPAAIVPAPGPARPAPVVPAGAVPAAPVPAGALPAGAVPATTVPATTVPATTVPATTVPAGAVPAGIAAPGTAGAGSAPAGRGPVGPSRSSVVSRASCARMSPVTGPGQKEVSSSPSPGTRLLAITDSSPSSRGRSAGALARHPATSSRSSGATSVMAGTECTTRYSWDACGPRPNGPVPVAANTITQPRENTSLGAPTRAPSACSGDMNEGVPMIIPVEVIAVFSSAREIPKSISRGPSMASSTLAGFRSRCTSPQEWTACSASTSPPASRHTDAVGKGPAVLTASASEGPGTNTVASHGGSSSGPAATTGAV